MFCSKSGFSCLNRGYHARTDTLDYIRTAVFFCLRQRCYYGDSGGISGAEKSINVQLQNGDNSPSLVQAWLDTGDASGSPGSVRVPFVITPPVSRIEPGTGQTLRIMYTGEPLPRDRESVFYLNVLDIPPRPEFGGKKADVGNVNYLQLAVRSRIKLFSGLQL